MKTIMFLVVCLGVLLPSWPSQAQKWAQESESAWENSSYTRTTHKPYTTRLTQGQLAASPDVDLAVPKFPKPLAEIIEVAFGELEKVEGTRQGWTVSDVQLTRSADVSLAQKPEFAKKWFWLVSFEGNGYGNVPQFAVTTDGHPGSVTTEKDKAQKPKLPFN